MKDKRTGTAPGRHCLLIELEAGLLLSGGPTPDVHAATLRRSGGLPYLPASALKGAIREQFSRLAGEDAAARILGRQGIGSRGKSVTPERPDGAPERPGGGTSLFYLGDGELISDPNAFEAGSAYSVRAQVAIERSRRRAAENHLFLRETVAPGQRLLFLAEADAGRLTPEDRTLLENVVKAVFAMGAGKTSGLGAIRMELLVQSDLTGRLAPAEAARANLVVAPRPTCELPPGENFELFFESVDPLSLGTDRDVGNFRRTRDYLPAAVLRGAILTAGIEAGAGSGPAGDRSGDPDFRRNFVDSETCVRFGDGVIGDDKGGSAMRAPPLTFQVCKTEPAKHGGVDTLLGSYLLALAAGYRRFAAPDLRCECGGRLAPRRRVASSPVERRVLTRVGMDRATGRAKDSQLFTLEVLEKGNHFRAILGGVGEEARALIQAALHETIRVGHGRGQGYGRLRCTRVSPLEDGESLGSRLERFAAVAGEKLGQLATRLGCKPAKIGADRQHFAVWLTSDLLPHRAGNESPENALLAALGLAGLAEVLAGDLRIEARGGWDALLHKPKPRRPVIAAGSAVLLRTSLELEELAKKLAPLERRGAGEGLELGFGWVRFSDPIHDPIWQKAK